MTPWFPLVLSCALLAGAPDFKEEANRSLAAGDWARLQALAEAQTALAPRDADAHLLLGVALANQGRSAEAIAAFRTAGGLAPDQVQPWYNLCLVGAQAMQRSLAAEGLDEVAKRNDGVALKLMRLAPVEDILGANLPATEVEPKDVKVRYQPPAPRYPTDSQGRRTEGTVLVMVVHDREGRVIRAQAISGPEALCPTAEAYAACWRFFPIPKESAAERFAFLLTMPFRLR
ncbi:MAG: Gram-negative bacterial TonB protein C-terminal [Holophagaceae bacterium]|nr:Gram-negative bacterial TonB protein C-terminal [Holophagaceae bacterium]